MANTSITFRYSLMNKTLFGFGAIFLGVLAYIAWINRTGPKDRTFILLLFFSFLGLVSFLYSFYSVTLTNRQIVVWRYFRESRLEWTDIYEVIPDSLDCFSLSDRNGDVKVFVSSQVKGYLELVRLIKQKRPDIWQFQSTQDFEDINVFRKSPWAAIYYGLGGIGLMIFAVIFHDGTTGTKAELFGRLIMFCLGFSVSIIAACTDRKLEFSGSYLILSYYSGWKKYIHINEVEKFYVEQQYDRTTLINAIKLKLKNGKAITFNGYKGGMPLLASVFEKWIKAYKRS